MTPNKYANGSAACESSELIQEIHSKVETIDTTLQGLVRDLIDEIRQFNKSLVKAVVYIAIGLSGMWFIDHFGPDRTEDFISKLKAETTATK